MLEYVFFDVKGVSQAFQRFGAVKSCVTSCWNKNLKDLLVCMVLLLLNDGNFKRMTFLPPIPMSLKRHV